LGRLWPIPRVFRNLGIFSLLSSRWISEEVDCYLIPKQEKRWCNSWQLPCLNSSGELTILKNYGLLRKNRLLTFETDGFLPRSNYVPPPHMQVIRVWRIPNGKSWKNGITDLQMVQRKKEFP